MTFPILGGNGAVGGYAIDNSLRFNDNDSPYMIWTPSSSGDNTYIWTFSTWIKRCTTASTAVGYDSIFSCYDGSNYSINIAIGNGAFSGTGDYFEITYVNSSYAVQWGVRTNALLRDNSAWYNLQIKFDTTQATANNRITLYVNGEEASVTRTNSPSQNTAYLFNTTTAHNFGRYAKDSNSWFDGYFAETHFIDGQALSPTDFGEFDEDSGIWKPIRYSGSYGTNGFYLDFENSGSLGADQSGNGNNFTPTNLASTDQTTDTPTNNFATLNPLDKPGTGNLASFAEGNLHYNKTLTGAGNNSQSNATFAVSTGKWYFELKQNDSNAIVVGIDYADNTGYDANGASLARSGGGICYANDGQKNIDGIYSSYGDSWTTNDIIGVAFDLDNNFIYFSKNGTFQNSGVPTSGATGTGGITISTTGVPYRAGVMNNGYNSTSSAFLNFGNPPFSISSGNSDDNGYGNFEYAPPSGYLALCTQNLATELSPTIDDGSQYFNTVLWTGNNVDDRSITGVGFQSDWVWAKCRDDAKSHEIYDSSRGATLRLQSDNTNAESTQANNLQAFESDGFQIGSGNGVNQTGLTFVAWNWKANAGSTSSNTDGSITSTVQANTTAGFSIVTYTGTGANATVGHGLNQAPEIIIVKNRDYSPSDWQTGSDYLTSWAYRLKLNGTNAEASVTSSFNSTAPTSTVINIGNNDDVNRSGDSHIIYAFHSVEGYSSINSYTGNGSTDGTFVYTGFRPAWVMVKRTDSTGNWVIYDSKRNGFNVDNDALLADTSNAEFDVEQIDLLSNGLKFRSTANSSNSSGGTYIYACFSANPFVSSTSIPVTAR